VQRERGVKVALVIVAGLVVLVALLALAELLGVVGTGVVRRLSRRPSGRPGRRRSGADTWADVREARRDAEVLQSRPDLGMSEWTSWNRRDRRRR
jgi:hypothetical protein